MKTVSLTLCATFALLCLGLATSRQNQRQKNYPGAFLPPNITRYRFINESLTWEEAHKICRGLDGHLALPRSKLEAEDIFELMANNSVTKIHAGFHDKFNPGKFVTVKGQSLDQIGYRKLSRSQPQAGQTRCGSLVQGVGLEPVSCNEALPSVCQVYLTDGYEFVEGFGHYKFYGYDEASKIWGDAVSTCFADGAYLLVVNSQEEYETLFEIYAPHIGRTVSYGGHQKFANNDFESIFGDSILATGFNVWSAVQPNDTSNLCYPSLSVFMSNSFYLRGLLLDTDFYPRPFICKKSLH